MQRVSERYRYLCIAHTISNRQETKLFKDVGIDSGRYRTRMAGGFPEARHGIGQGNKN